MSIEEVKKYFKPLALSFKTGWRSKTLFEIPPEAYLIISVSITPSGLLSAPRFGFLTQC